MVVCTWIFGLNDCELCARDESVLYHSRSLICMTIYCITVNSLPVHGLMSFGAESNDFTVISELKPHWSLIESSRQGPGRLDNEPWVYCLSSGVLSPRPCGILEYYPLCYCEVFGPGKGNVWWKVWCKVGSTVLFVSSNVDGVSTSWDQVLQMGNWLLRADCILLLLVSLWGTFFCV